MKEYIWKFLSVIFSLNLFLSGIANSMMPTPNKKVIDYSTGEEIPLGGIDKEEILSDGTKLIYVSQKNIESRKEEIEKIIFQSTLKYDGEGSPVGPFFMLAGAVASYNLDSSIPLALGVLFGLKGTVNAFKQVYIDITGTGRMNPSPLVGIPLRYFETANDYPYGLVLMRRPSKIDSNVGVYYSCVYEQDCFHKDELIKEISRGC